MPDQTPATELRAAAEKLQQAAAAAEQASPSPWHLDQSTYGAGIVYAANDTIIADRSMDDTDDDHGDMPYLALMQPQVGAALARWLEATAAEMQAADGTEYACSEFASWTAALAAARAILTGGDQ